MMGLSLWDGTATQERLVGAKKSRHELQICSVRTAHVCLIVAQIECIAGLLRGLQKCELLCIHNFQLLMYLAKQFKDCT